MTGRGFERGKTFQAKRRVRRKKSLGETLKLRNLEKAEKNEPWKGGNRAKRTAPEGKKDTPKTGVRGAKNSDTKRILTPLGLIHPWG